MGKKVRDEQTGKEFYLKPEQWPDRVAACISIIYLVLIGSFFFWQLFDIWAGEYSILKLLGYDSTKLTSDNFRIFVYCFIGGALGGIVKEIRSFLFWHCEQRAFGGQFIWKSLATPWLGALLALFVMVLVRSGIAIFSGDFAVKKGGTQIYSLFALSMLTGYGSHRVFIWLDSHVRRIFKIAPKTDEPDSKTIIPDLIGKKEKEISEILKKFNVKMGKIEKKPADNKKMIGLVIKQNPLPEAKVDSDTKVDITIGT